MRYNKYSGRSFDKGVDLDNMNCFLDNDDSAKQSVS